MGKKPVQKTDSAERFTAVLDEGTVPLEPDEHVVIPRYDDEDYSAPATPGSDDAA